MTEEEDKGLQSLRPMLTVLRGAAIAAAAVFAFVAWVPGDDAPFGIFEGIFMIGFGLVLLSLPILGASIAVTAQRWTVRLLIGLPLAAVALVVGFMWSSLIHLSRNPSWSLH